MHRKSNYIIRVSFERLSRKEICSWVLPPFQQETCMIGISPGLVRSEVRITHKEIFGFDRRMVRRCDPCMCQNRLRALRMRAVHLVEQLFSARDISR